MALALPAADGLAPAVHLQGARAVELAVFVHQALFQSGGGGDDLEGGAGVVQEGHRLVAPLGINCLGAGGSPLLLVGDGVDLGLRLFRQDKGLVGVKIGIGGHGQDTAVVHVHHQADGRALNVVVVIGDLQVFLQEVLQHLVDGEHQRLALFGRIVQLVVLGEGVAPGVGEGHRPSGGAGEDVVIFLLQTGEALLVGAHAAQNMGQKAAVGVVPGGVFGKVQGALQGIVRNELPDLIGFVLFDAPHKHLVGVVFLGLGQHILGGDLFQKAGQLCLQQIQAIGLYRLLLRVGEGLFFAGQAQHLHFMVAQLRGFLGGDLPGVHDEHLGAGRDGQGLSVGVVNGAPGGVDGDVTGLAGKGLLLVKFLVYDLQKGQSDDDGRRA